MPRREAHDVRTGAPEGHPLMPVMLGRPLWRGGEEALEFPALDGPVEKWAQYQELVHKIVLLEHRLSSLEPENGSTTATSEETCRPSDLGESLKVKCRVATATAEVKDSTMNCEVSKALEQLHEAQLFCEEAEDARLAAEQALQLEREWRRSEMQRAADLTKQLEQVSWQLEVAHHAGKARLDTSAQLVAPQSRHIQRETGANSRHATGDSDSTCRHKLLGNVGQPAERHHSNSRAASPCSIVSSEQQPLDGSRSSIATLQGKGLGCQQRGATVSVPTPKPSAARTTTPLATCNVFLKEASICSRPQGWPLPLMARTLSQPCSSHETRHCLMQTGVQYPPRQRIEVAQNLSPTDPNGRLQQHDPMTAAKSPLCTPREPFNFRASSPKLAVFPPCTPRKPFNFSTPPALTASPPKFALWGALATQNVKLHRPEVWQPLQITPRTTALKATFDPQTGGPCEHALRWKAATVSLPASLPHSF